MTMFRFYSLSKFRDNWLMDDSYSAKQSALNDLKDYIDQDNHYMC